MSKKDFKVFKVGAVFNSLSKKSLCVKPVFKRVELLYPSRLNAMALDPSKIAKNKNLCYSPGEIIFKVKIYKKVVIEIIPENKSVIISERSKRKSLITHAVLLMKKGLKINDGFFIDVDNRKEIKHAGLGSSSGLISSVACAINELYGNPIERDDLIKYLAQNHGEETENENFLSPVQCIGGSAAAGLYGGALLIIAGESVVISSRNISKNYKAVIGIPNDFKELSADVLLKKEIKSFGKFIKTGEKFSQLIAYRLLHNVLPSLEAGRLNEIGDLIYDYRFKMGSIENCSYAYSKLPKIAEKLKILKNSKIAKVLSISSVGPAFFAITEKSKECKKMFERENLKTFVVDIENEGYTILKKE